MVNRFLVTKFVTDTYEVDENSRQTTHINALDARLQPGFVIYKVTNSPYYSQKPPP